MSWTVRLERGCPRRGSRTCTLFVEAISPVHAMRTARARAASQYGGSVESWLVTTCLPDPDFLRRTG